MRPGGLVIRLFKYTAEQSQAVYELDKNIILGAGAGSGKTRVLTSRYIQLLETGRAELEEILAITFTRKAANEMVERIREELLKRIRQTSDKEKKLWHERLLKINRARISTFHSFAGRILRDNPVTAALDPEFRVLDEEESARLLEEAVDRIIEQGLAIGDSSLLILAREYGLYNLSELLKNLYYTYSRSSQSIEKVKDNSKRSLAEAREKFSVFKREIIELGNSIVEIASGEKLSGKTAEKVNNFAGKWPDIRETLLQLENIDQIELLNKIVEIPAILKGRMAKAVNEVVKELRDRIKGDEFTGFLLLDRAEYLLEPLLDVMSRVVDEYNSAKKEMVALDFSDLEERFLDLFNNDIDLLAKLQNSIKYIMVDEFQDNSPRQERLIKMLAEGEEVNLFLVGDPKQSIYRFRGADVKVFNRQKMRIIEEDGCHLKLTKNFRSRNTVLAFVNYIFSKLMMDSEEPFVDYQELRAERQYDRDSVELLLIDRAELPEDDYRKQEAIVIARRIKEMVEKKQVMVGDEGDRREIKYGDIALLFQTLTNISLYEEALQYLGIPYQIVNGRGFYEQQEVIDIVNLLKVIDNSSRGIPLAGLLRSPFCGIDDEDLYYLGRQGVFSDDFFAANLDQLSATGRKQVEGLRKIIRKGKELKDSISTDELIRKLLADSSYWYKIAGSPYYQQQRANIQKLIKLIEEYENINQPSLREIIEYLREKREKYYREGLALPEKEGSNLVQLMTVHQSKGLEFPVVFVPDCQCSVFNHNYVFPILLDSELGLGIKIKINYNNKSQQPTPVYQQLFERERVSEIAESLRVFYVAATRARDYLVLSGSVKGDLKYSSFEDGNSWLDWLAYSFNLNLLEAAENDNRLSYKYGDYQGRLKVRVAGDISSANVKDRVVEETAAGNATIDFNLPEIKEWDNEEEWHEKFTGTGPIDILPTDKKPVISVTAYQAYLVSPRRYYLRYVKGFPEYTVKRDKTDKSSSFESEGLTPAEKGTLIHRIWELSEEGRDLNIALDQALQEMRLITKKSSGLFAEILPLLTDYLNRGKDTLLEGAILDKKYHERGFLLEFNDFRLVGKIDRMEEYTDGSARIIDLKTNNINKDEIDVKTEYYRPQLELYALAAYRIWGLSPVTCRIDYIIPGESREFIFDSQSLQGLEKKIIEVGNKMLSLIDNYTL